MVKFLLSRDGYIPVPGGGHAKAPTAGSSCHTPRRALLSPIARVFFRPLMAMLAALGRWRGEERFLLATTRITHAI